jgi:tRNA-dihydrouridine synthase B
MAGVTDYPFRQIIRQMGCELVYTEMVSSKGLVYGNRRTEELLQFSRDGVVGVQLFGEKPEIMAEAAELVAAKFNPDLIDINMGCPTPKIVKNGAGAALMKKPELVGKIVARIVRAVEIPVTVKIRKGWDNNNENAVEIARIAENNGVTAVAIHGRTREQFYAGTADWEIIKKLKKKLSIPLLGNGDVFTPEKAGEMFEITGCDGVMIARGARGNPWLFERAAHYIKTGELLPEPGYKEVVEMALYHLKLAVDYYGSEVAIPRMRKHLGWYLKGLPYSTDVKDKINKLTDLQDVKEVLITYLNKLLAQHS